MKSSIKTATQFGDYTLINRLKYKGRGRPKKTDYMSLQEVQEQINSLYNRYLDNLKMRIK